MKIFIKSEKETDFKRGWFFKKLSSIIPITEELNSNKFIIKKGGKIFFTPLFISLCLIENADLVFAIDSIPAVLSISQNFMIVFTSNIFAILCLRSSYTIISNYLQKIKYLDYGLAAMLGFIGIKMILTPVGIHMPFYITFFVIFIVITATLAFSYFGKPRL